jgi:sulfite reductase (ferredoxin)
LERVLKTEYPQYSNNKGITIKISGCMNAGQHNMSEIGFQGMSINAGKLVTCASGIIRWWNIRKRKRKILG